MKITIATGPFLPLPPDGFGAVEVLWHELGREFAARGHEVTFFTRNWADLATDETVDGVRVIRVRGLERTGRLKWDLVKDMLYSARAFFKVPAGDICVTNAVWLPVLLARWKPSAGRVVVNVQRAPKGQMRLYRRTARLACASSAVLQDVIKQTPDIAPLARVLPNPINTRAFVPPAMPRRWDGRRYLAYTGRVHPEKGVHVLVDAFKRLPDQANVTLRIVGPTEASRGGGGEPYLSDLKARSVDRPVEFIPPIADRGALARLLQESHFYCYPSLAEKGESFGVAPLEAMATGLAPIVSDLACFRDFLNDGVNGVIFDHRTDPVGQLSVALRRMIDDPGGAVKMGTVAAATARDFSNSTVSEKFLEDFRMLLSDQPGKR